MNLLLKLVAPKTIGGKLKRWVKQERRVLLTSGGVATFVILLRLSGLLQLWELAAFDQLFRLRPTESVDERILIVEISEEDLQAAGTWPIPDQTMTELLEKIHSYEPSVIGLDVYRSFPVEPGSEKFQQFASETSNLIGIEKIEDTLYPATPPAQILAAKDQVGFNNVMIDLDGKVRRSLLYWTGEGHSNTGLALKLALHYLQNKGIIPQPSANNPNYLQLGQAVFPDFKKNDGAYARADDGGYQVLVNFRDPHSFNKVTMSDILTGKVNASQIQGKIVMIGTTAPSLKDIFYTPYNTDLIGSTEPIYGVQLQANFVSHILSAALSERPIIKVWSQTGEWLWIFGWSFIGAVAIVKSRSPLQMLSGFLSTGIILGGIVYLAFLGGWWIPYVSPLLGLAGSAIVLTSQIVYQQEELKRSKEFLQTIIDKIPDPVFVKDQQHRWLLLNQAFCQFSGYPLRKLLGKSERDVFPESEAEILYRQDEMVFNTEEAQEDEAPFTDAAHNQRLIATKRSLHKDAAGNIFLVGVIRDITERKQIEEKLRQLASELSRDNAKLKRSANQLKHDAYHDDLTGLANRKLFYESLMQSLEWAQINQQLVGLLFVDLDGFKAVNDNLGHDCGDLLLKTVAKRLVNDLRSSDIVSRLGGDEFTIILPGIKKIEYTATVAQKILDTLSQPIILNENKAHVTGSIGISVYPHDGETIEDLIKQADSAMYRAKKLGRNQYQFLKS